MKIRFFLFLVLTCCVACLNQAKKIKCKGSISGNILALEGFIDSGTIVCAFDTLKKETYVFDKWDNGDKFQLDVPEGVYFVYEEKICQDAMHNNIKCKGYYTDYMRLGYYKKDGSASHKPIAIKVDCNKVISNIIVGDFWGN